MQDMTPFDFSRLAPDDAPEPGASPDAAAALREAGDAVREAEEREHLAKARFFETFSEDDHDKWTKAIHAKYAAARARLASLRAEAGDGVLPFKDGDV